MDAIGVSMYVCLFEWYKLWMVRINEWAVAVAADGGRGLNGGGDSMECHKNIGTRTGMNERKWMIFWMVTF